MGQFFPGPPVLSQRFHEQGDRGKQIAEPSQVERTVVSLRVVVQEPCETQITGENFIYINATLSSYLIYDIFVYINS